MSGFPHHRSTLPLPVTILTAAGTGTFNVSAGSKVAATLSDGRCGVTDQADPYGLGLSRLTSCAGPTSTYNSRRPFLFSEPPTSSEKRASLGNWGKAFRWLPLISKERRGEKTGGFGCGLETLSIISSLHACQMCSQSENVVLSRCLKRLCQEESF